MPTEPPADDASSFEARNRVILEDLRCIIEAHNSGLPEREDPIIFPAHGSRPGSYRALQHFVWEESSLARSKSKQLKLANEGLFKKMIGRHIKGDIDIHSGEYRALEDITFFGIPTGDGDNRRHGF